MGFYHCRVVVFSTQVVEETHKLTKCRKNMMKLETDCSALPSEAVAKQHKLVVCKTQMKSLRYPRHRAIQKTKWWKLTKEKCVTTIR